MSPSTVATKIRMRLVFIFLIITWPALARLSSATRDFAVVLRDRAESDLVTPSDFILDMTFQNLMDNAVDGMVIVALVSAHFPFPDWPF
jgi:hypothetical protein